MRLAQANLGDGHAMTRHKAQGATVDVALVYGSSRPPAKPALLHSSGGPSANQLCVARRDDDALDEATAGRTSMPSTSTGSPPSSPYAACRPSPSTGHPSACGDAGAATNQTRCPNSADLRRNLEMTDRLLVSPVEAANLLGIGRSTVYVLMQSGELASVRVGGSRRIPVAALDELVNRLRGAADPMSWPRRNGNVSA